jgi:hypothetical protein
VLQRIIAALLIVVGVVGVGLAVASATIWRPDDTVIATAQPAGQGTLVVTAPGVLDLVNSDVTIRATVPAGETVAIAIGRDVDVAGWIGTDPYTLVTGLASWHRLTGKPVVPSPSDTASPDAATPDASASPDATSSDASASPGATASPSATAASGPSPVAEGTIPTIEAPDVAGTGAVADETPLEGPNPDGSAMWEASTSGTRTATLRWSDRPGRWQVIAAGVGGSAMAPALELSWPRIVTTPWLWPGVGAGTLLFAMGVGIVAISVRAGPRSRASRVGALPPAQHRLEPVGAARAAAERVSSGPVDMRPAAWSYESAHLAPGTRTGAGQVSGPVRPGAHQADAPGLGQEPITRTMTRREIRALAEAQARSERPRRSRLTGAIPVVPTTRQAAPQEPAATAQPRADTAGPPHGDAWRKAWGIQVGIPGPDGPGIPDDNLDDQTHAGHGIIPGSGHFDGAWADPDGYHHGGTR